MSSLFDDPSLRWDAYLNHAQGRFNLYAFDDSSRERSVIHIYEAVTVPVQRGCHVSPTLDFELNQAQQLFQAFWDAGLRPARYESTSAQVDAVKCHLEDMRRITFNKLEIPYVEPK